MVIRRRAGQPTQNIGTQRDVAAFNKELGDANAVCKAMLRTSERRSRRAVGSHQI